MSKSNSEILSGLVRSIRKAAKRHERGDFSDCTLVDQVKEAIDRTKFPTPLTDEERCQHTKV
jgi:hypothetical protein